ncbi:hypothetical protein Q7P37_002686 [Cladosporium fusiforme]
MFYRTFLLAAVALTGAVNAQSRNETGTGPELDNPGSVPLAERATWCRAQTQNCPRICGGSTTGGGNTCDPVTLTYSCICSDGNSPNISDFEQTLPGQVCRKSVEQCVINHPDDAEGIAECRSVVCGERTDYDEASSSSSSSATASETASSTSSGGSSDATETGSSTSGSDDDSASQTSDSSSASETADSDSAASALMLGSSYGTGLLAVGIFAAFGLAL